MYTQEQEHYDFMAGAASELQNCFSEAQMRVGQLSAIASEPIERALALGLFVVVEEIPYHCKSTDAFAGCIPTFRIAVSTREGAEAWINRHADDFDPDCHVVIRHGV